MTNKLPSVKIAILGGSGIYKMEGVEITQEIDLDTPFGKPSDKISIMKIENKTVAFIPRHGKVHSISPSHIPYRANIWALKKLGVKFILSLSAVGSLCEEYKPGDIVVPDQLVDWTKDRFQEKSFFNKGIACHVSLAEPFCKNLNQVCYKAVQKSQSSAPDGNKLEGQAHLGGASVTIEGPRFSTRAESEMFRQMNFKIVGMTTCNEAFLSREAEMAYSVMHHITDYDCWHQAHDNVSVEQVMIQAGKNVILAQTSVKNAIAMLDENMASDAFTALGNGGAIMTKKESITAEGLDIIIGKYL